MPERADISEPLRGRRADGEPGGPPRASLRAAAKAFWRRLSLLTARARASDSPAALIRSGAWARPSVVGLSAASQLSASMCLFVVLGYEGRLDPDAVVAGLQRLADERPEVCGRISRGRWGWRLSDTSLSDCNAGIEFRVVEAGESTREEAAGGEVRDVRGPPRAYASHEHPPPPCCEPLDADEVGRGKAPLIRLRLTQCREGSLLALSVSHALADGGGAARLLSRLSQLARQDAGERGSAGAGAGEGGLGGGESARAAGALASPTAPLLPAREPRSPRTLGIGLSELLRGQVELRASWHAPVLDSSLSWGQLLRLPAYLWRAIRAKWEVARVALSARQSAQLKSLAAGGDLRVSTQDAVQALAGVLIRDACAGGSQAARNDGGVGAAARGPLHCTLNVDLSTALGRAAGTPAGEGAALEGLGVQVHIMRVELPSVGEEKGGGGNAADGDDDPLADGGKSSEDGPRSPREEGRGDGSRPLAPPARAPPPSLPALRGAARASRAALTTLREGGLASLADTLSEQEQMASIPLPTLVANFLSKGAEEKAYSTSSLVSFPWDQIRFPAARLVGAPSLPPCSLDVAICPHFERFAFLYPTLRREGEVAISLSVPEGRGRASLAHPLLEALGPP